VYIEISEKYNARRGKDAKEKYRTARPHERIQNRSGGFGLETGKTNKPGSS
jgi:hypothetical protein